MQNGVFRNGMFYPTLQLVTDEFEELPLGTTGHHTFANAWGVQYPVARGALLAAIETMYRYFRRAQQQLSEGADWTDTFVTSLVPEHLSKQYTAADMERFYRCCVVIENRMAQQTHAPSNCMAEDVLMFSMTRLANLQLRAEGIDQPEHHLDISKVIDLESDASIMFLPEGDEIDVLLDDGTVQTVSYDIVREFKEQTQSTYGSPQKLFEPFENRFVMPSLR